MLTVCGYFGRNQYRWLQADHEYDPNKFVKRRLLRHKKSLVVYSRGTDKQSFQEDDRGCDLANLVDKFWSQEKEVLQYCLRDSPATVAIGKWLHFDAVLVRQHISVFKDECYDEYECPHCGAVFRRSIE